ncbi:MAG: hypothetical protein Q9218_003439 [Villophora microphyllina]
MTQSAGRSRPIVQARERDREAIKVVNETYAICKSKDSRTQARGRAFRVYQACDDVFYVPATRAHYQVLRKVQHKSEARRARTTFFKAISLPGNLGRVPSIRIQMPNAPHEILSESGSAIAVLLNNQDWRKDGKRLYYRGTGSASKSPRAHTDVAVLTAGTACKWKLPGRRIKYYQPDSSLRFPIRKAANKKLPFPFLIVEVAVSQTDKKLATKIHRWIQGSRGHLKYLCVLRLWPSEGTTPTKVTATIIQPCIVLAPTPPNPAEWLMDSRHIVPEVEVYPRIPTESFTISSSDTWPKYLIPDPAFSSQQVTIPFEIFHIRGEAAAAEFDATASNASSSFHSNQRDVPTPPESEPNLDVDSSGDEPDDSEGEDPLYEEGD